MQNQDLISIVVPMYNSEKYIYETVISVINQTYTNWELIIIDDYSTDKSVDIVENLIKNDNRIKLVKSVNNFGSAAKPRNIGIQQAKGDYIAFLDSDDVWTKHKLEDQLNYMKSKGSLISCTDINEINENGKLLPNKKKLNKIVFSLLTSYDLKLLLITNRVCTSSVILKSSLLNDLKFDEDKNIAPVEDYHLWLSLLLSNKVSQINRLKKRLVNYRIHDSNISTDYSMMVSKANYCRSKAIAKYGYTMPGWLSFIQNRIGNL